MLWLWCRPAAVAPIRPLVWEPAYAADAALKKKKFVFSITVDSDSLFPFLLRALVLVLELVKSGYD